MTRARIDPSKQARAIAEKYGVQGAPVPVEKIAKQMGAELRISVLDDEISGMVYIANGTPIIGVNGLHHPNRQRFTIAHEIGHLTMHRDVLLQEVHVDKQYRVLNRVLQRNQDSSSGTETMEIQANAFAAELLMPTKIFEAAMRSTPMVDMDDEEPLNELAKKFRVSKQAVQYRIRHLTLGG